MLIETDITIGIYGNTDYHYEVSVGQELKVSYVETVDGAFKEDHSEVYFGSIEEMEAVAKAMLKACELYKVK